MKKLISSLVCALSVTASLFVGVSQASGQAAPLPRFLPAESAGYTLTSTSEDAASSGSTYVGYFGNQSNTKSIEVTADATQSADLTSDLKSRAKKGERVHGKPAVVSVDDTEVSVVWLEKGNLYRVKFRGTSRKGVLAFAQNVRPTGKADSSFTVKSLPVGLSTIYIGPESGLAAGGYQAEFNETGKGDNRVSLLALNVDPRYIKVAVSQLPDAVPTTVRGKPGYRIGASGDLISLLLWMEQPNLALIVVAGVQSPSTFAESLMPVDEPTWKAASDLAAANTRAIESGNSGPVGPPVAAGNIADIAWAASVSAQCLIFAAGSSTVSVCAPGITSPTLVAWKPLVVKQKTLVFGIAGANVTTVVAKSAGVELIRIPTQVVVDQPGLRYFAIELTVNPTAVTFVGLDAAGVELGPATAAQPR